MKIAFFTYPAAFQNIGGGEILLLKLQQYLTRAGVEVKFFDIWKDRVEDYDVLQVFGSVKDCLGLVRVANARNVPVATLPILWSDPKHTPLRHWIKTIYPAYPSERRELLVRSDILFPNSELEKKQIARLFAIPEAKMTVVYNGVDPAFQNADPTLFLSRYGNEPFVLSVGRIEPRKNQLNLIRAMGRMQKQKLVLIGSPVSGYEDYYKACQKEGSARTTFIPTQPHGDALLKSAYAACAVFVLQGYFETPGLAAMEAALGGARLVVTSGGSTREYFGNLVEYLDPSNPQDIAQKIDRALRGRPTPDLTRRILDSFTWDRIAQRYLECYQHLLEKRG